MPARQHTPDPLMRAGWEVEYNEMEYITGSQRATGPAVQETCCSDLKHQELHTKLCITGQILLCSVFTSFKGVFSSHEHAWCNDTALLFYPQEELGDGG